MKLRRKLLAAGFAFGATALTLTTSTFAWYTSNTEATVTSFSGATSATADTNSFYVAAAQTYDADNGYAAKTFGSYLSKVNPVLTEKDETHVLVPVAYSGKVTTPAKDSTPESTADTETSYVPFLDTKHVDADDDAEPAVTEHDEVRYGAYSAKNVYEYVLRFRKANSSNSATPLYFSAFNLTTAKKTGYTDQIALAYGGTTGIESAGAYFADLAKAMKLTIKVQNLKADSTAAAVEGFIADGVATSTVYDLSSLGSNNDLNISNANAVGYYNTVLNKQISGTATSGTAITKGTAGASNALAFASIPASGYVEVTFTFWLDGWDEYCYDIMQQQTFTFDFEASTSDAKSVIHTTA